MKKNLFSIILLTLVNIMGFSILIPVLPFIVDKYGGNAITYGILLSSYAIFQFVGAPIMGSLSDRYGRRPVLLLSQMGTLLSWVLFGVAYFVPELHIGGFSLPILVIILSRFTDGITGGNMSVSYAYIADISTPSEKTKFFGYAGAIAGVGLILGPVIGGYSSSTSIGFLGTAIFSFFLSLITIISMYYYLPESLSKEKRTRDVKINISEDFNLFLKYKRLSDSKYLKNLFILKIFFTFIYSCYTSIIILFVRNRFDLNEQMLANVFVIVGLFLLINHGLLPGFLSKRIGDMNTFYSGLAFMIVGITSHIFITNLISFYFASYIAVLGISLALPSFKALITNGSALGRQGEVTGLDESVFSASSATAPLISSMLYFFYGGNMFLLFGVFLLLPFLYLILTTGGVMIRQNSLQTN